MSQCENCHSFAINLHMDGRDGRNPHLCDGCHWRGEVAAKDAEIASLRAEVADLRDEVAQLCGYDNAREMDDQQKADANRAALAQVAEVGK